MRLLHVYDHDYICRDGAIYSSGGFSRDVWSRYLDAFDSLTVVANIRESSHADLDALNRVDRDRVTFRFVPRVRTPRRVIGGLLGRNRELRALVKEVDAVAVRLTSELGYQAAAFAKYYDKPLAVEAVDCPWDAYTSHSVVGKLVAPLAWWRMRQALSQADHALYVTEHFLQRRYPTRGVAAHASNVVLVDHASSIEKTTFDASRLRIGLVGNCDVRLKGHRVLLKAVQRLQSADSSARLIFIGGGDRDVIEKEIKACGLVQRVEFTGRVSAGARMMTLLDSLDIYVHPSYKEGLPRAVIEAMSRGLPVLASSAGGTGELLDDQWLHKPGDSTRLAMQLEHMLDDPELRRREGKKNAITSTRYAADVLDAKRRDFWHRFERYCAVRKGETASG